MSSADPAFILSFHIFYSRNCFFRDPVVTARACHVSDCGTPAKAVAEGDRESQMCSSGEILPLWEGGERYKGRV
jgi:hypothetical protein